LFHPQIRRAAYFSIPLEFKERNYNLKLGGQEDRLLLSC